MNQRRKQQPASLEARPTEDEVRASVDRAVDSIRDFLLMLARLAGPPPGEPKP
jgi:hypothetical protein